MKTPLELVKSKVQEACGDNDELKREKHQGDCVCEEVCLPKIRALKEKAKAIVN